MCMLCNMFLLLTCYFTNVCRSKSSSELMFHVICIRQKIYLLCLSMSMYMNIISPVNKVLKIRNFGDRKHTKEIKIADSV